MDRTEKIVKAIYRLYRRGYVQPASSCPDEESLVCFCEGKFSGLDLEVLQKHISVCQDCAEKVILFNRATEEIVIPPKLLIEKTKNLLARNFSVKILEIVLKVKEKALKIIKTNADIIFNDEIMPLAILRSKQGKDSFHEPRQVP